LFKKISNGEQLSGMCYRDALINSSQKRKIILYFGQVKNGLLKAEKFASVTFLVHFWSYDKRSPTI
jgi:hypothetical protein